MSQQLVQFTANSVEKAKRAQTRFAWVMAAGLASVVFFFLRGGGVFLLLGILLIVASLVGWSVSGNRIQRLTREHLEAKAAWEKDAAQR